jgi:outer membrane protein OmpA-like peptidoglycan-associated protein
MAGGYHAAESDSLPGPISAAASDDRHFSNTKKPHTRNAMTTSTSIRNGIVLLSSIMGMLLSAGFMSYSQAEELSHQDMVCALTGQCATPFVDRRVRGVTTTVVPRPPMSFDATVNFAFDSAELTADAKKELDKIIEVLKDPKVGDADVIIGGHTDAKGSEDYNKKLSERRALAVKLYLSQNGIDKKRLTATGYSKDKLLLPNEPLNALNRRVEFRNVKGVASTETITPVAGEGL